MKTLGIDYGTKRIGLAISDDDGKIAFPKLVLKNDREVFSKIMDLFTEEEIDKVVLGESKDFKMKDNPVMKDIGAFKEELERQFDVEVILFPEVLSSHQAAKMAGGKNDMIDASAAAIILQSYLDSL